MPNNGSTFSLVYLDLPYLKFEGYAYLRFIRPVFVLNTAEKV